MPLIEKPFIPPIKEQFRVRIEKRVLDDIDAYCKWQDVDRDYFIEQAALKIFKKDKDWLAYKKSIIA
ncbi:MAG: hypothetical protein QXN55_09200 [Candidatus Nitrosotenuis sp.]